MRLLADTRIYQERGISPPCMVLLLAVAAAPRLLASCQRRGSVLLQRSRGGDKSSLAVGGSAWGAALKLTRVIQGL